jgi:hypothetical protein
MEYGVIYIKVCPVKGSKAEWIKYCHIFSSTPLSFQQNVKEWNIEERNSTFQT